MSGRRCRTEGRGLRRRDFYTAQSEDLDMRDVAFVCADLGRVLFALTSSGSGSFVSTLSPTSATEGAATEVGVGGDRVSGPDDVWVAEALADIRSSCRFALALVAGHNFVVDWAVAFASAACCEVAEAT